MAVQYSILTKIFACLLAALTLYTDLQSLNSSKIDLSQDKRIFLGIIIKNNDLTIPSFLQTIEWLDYDKKLIDVQFTLYNQSASVQDYVKKWIQKNQASYSQITCVDTNQMSRSMGFDPIRITVFKDIKNDFLRKTIFLNCDYCFIVESDVFLRPFTLNVLLNKKKPVISPLLRSTPEYNDPFSNFFGDVTESGYYKDHPDYMPIAKREKLGTFGVPCVSYAYLICADSIGELSFSDTHEDWEFLAFSRNARKNNVDQFICNEKEFGFLLHFFTDLTLEKEKGFFLQGIDKKVDITLLNNIFSKYCEDDSYLQEHINTFCYENYAIYPVENRDLFYLDESFDFIKSHYLKKGMPWESHIHEKFKKYTKPGSVAIDIGGHIGTHALNLSRIVGENGTVHVFEPQVKIFTELVINMFLNNCKNVMCYRQALGNESRWIEMYKPNSFNEGMAYINKLESNTLNDKAKMQPLDSYGFNNVSIIKIDVEGFEMDVIEGAKETILRNKPVMIIEIFSGPDFQKKVDIIKSFGYQVTNLGGEDYLFLPLNL